MRFVLLVLLALGGCGKSGVPSGEDMAMAGGGTGGGGGGTGGVGGAGGGGGAVRDCTASCNRCPNGPCCGTACCNSGEWCDTTTNTCKCGDAPACTGGNFCAHGGPVGPNPNPCGTTCCGTPGFPCPL